MGFAKVWSCSAAATTKIYCMMNALKETLNIYNEVNTSYYEKYETFIFDNKMKKI